MSQLSDNLSARADDLGLSVTDVHQEMSRRGFSVAYSTVAGWFNGSRGVRSMDHLIALCKILKTDLASITKGEIELAEEDIEVQLLRETRQLTKAQKEILLALAKNLSSS